MRRAAPLLLLTACGPSLSGDSGAYRPASSNLSASKIALEDVSFHCANGACSSIQASVPVTPDTLAWSLNSGAQTGTDTNFVFPLTDGLHDLDLTITEPDGTTTDRSWVVYYAEKVEDDWGNSHVSDLPGVTILPDATNVSCTRFPILTISGCLKLGEPIFFRWETSGAQTFEFDAGAKDPEDAYQITSPEGPPAAWVLNAVPYESDHQVVPMKSGVSNRLVVFPTVLPGESGTFTSSHDLLLQGVPKHVSGWDVEISCNLQNKISGVTLGSQNN